MHPAAWVDERLPVAKKIISGIKLFPDVFAYLPTCTMYAVMVNGKVIRKAGLGKKYVKHYDYYEKNMYLILSILLSVFSMMYG